MFEQAVRMQQRHNSAMPFPEDASDPEARAALLGRQADEMLANGQCYEALQSYDAALAIARDLARKYRGNDQYSRMIAGLQYSRAGALIALNRHTEAIEALDESERRYQEVSAGSIAHIEALFADIQTRRGLARHLRGYGISAALDLDAAVVAYRWQLTRQQDDPYRLKLARALAINAHILRAWGDPDLAVASADAAMRLYKLAERTAEYRAQATAHMEYWHMAANVAAELHAAQGRLQSAIVADATASAIAQSMLNHHHSIRYRQLLAGALVRQGLHMQALDGSRKGEALIARGRELDARAARQAMTQWRQAQAGDDPARMTLAAALAAAAQELGSSRVPDTLISALTRPAVHVALLSPSDRCSLNHAADYARQLAEISLALWHSRRGEALRLGIESHYLFAVASRMQTTATRHLMYDYGPIWARVLLACAQEYESRRLVSAAFDVAAWAGRVAAQLLPISLLDQELRPLIRECLERYSRLRHADGAWEAGQRDLRHT